MTTKPRTTLDILVTARAMIASPRQWTRGASVGGRYSVNGAVTHATIGLPTLERGALSGAWEALRAVLPEAFAGSLMGYNADRDTRHENVIALLDDAIAHVQMHRLELAA